MDLDVRYELPDLRLSSGVGSGLGASKNQGGEGGLCNLQQLDSGWLQPEMVELVSNTSRKRWAWSMLISLFAKSTVIWKAI